MFPVKLFAAGPREELDLGEPQPPANKRVLCSGEHKAKKTRRGKRGTRTRCFVALARQVSMSAGWIVR
jgi:hypothetical protein